MIGQLMRCKVTGFEGIAVAKVEYLNGCVQYCLKPKSKDGKMLDGEYIDIQQLEKIGEGLLDVEKIDNRQVAVGEVVGGNMSDTPGGSYRG